jgi:hypothetical protein
MTPQVPAGAPGRHPVKLLAKWRQTKPSRWPKDLLAGPGIHLQSPSTGMRETETGTKPRPRRVIIDTSGWTRTVRWVRPRTSKQQLSQVQAELLVGSFAEVARVGKRRKPRM